jgi:hypothetical protein
MAEQTRMQILSRSAVIVTPRRQQQNESEAITSMKAQKIGVLLMVSGCFARPLPPFQAYGVIVPRSTRSSPAPIWGKALGEGVGKSLGGKALGTAA